MSLSNRADDERRNRRRQLEMKWEKHYRPQRPRLNEKSRAASTDLARLDIAGWLARQKATAHHRPTGDTSDVKVGVPEPQQPHSATIGVRTQPESNDLPIGSLCDALEPHESQLGQAKPGDEPEKRGRPEPPSERSERSGPDAYTSAVDQVITCAKPGESLPVRTKPGNGPEDRSGAEPQSEPSESGQPEDILLSMVKLVEILAKAMTGTWAEIAAELDATKEAPGDIKRQLADHGWCDLFIGLVLVIETSQHALDKIPESAKELVKWAIHHSSMQVKRPRVTDDVVDIVVERVWKAFKEVMVGQVPLLKIITGEDALRSLRILAVFTCPAPEKHKEVCEHALKPLGDDAREILTAQTKMRLVKLFDEWATGGANSTSAA